MMADETDAAVAQAEYLIAMLFRGVLKRYTKDYLEKKVGMAIDAGIYNRVITEAINTLKRISRSLFRVISFEQFYLYFEMDALFAFCPDQVREDRAKELGYYPLPEYFKEYRKSDAEEHFNEAGFLILNNLPADQQLVDGIMCDIFDDFKKNENIEAKIERLKKEVDYEKLDYLRRKSAMMSLANGWFEGTDEGIERIDRVLKELRMDKSDPKVIKAVVHGYSEESGGYGRKESRKKIAKYFDLENTLSNLVESPTASKNIMRSDMYWPAKLLGPVRCDFTINIKDVQSGVHPELTAGIHRRIIEAADRIVDRFFREYPELENVDRKKSLGLSIGALRFDVIQKYFDEEPLGYLIRLSDIEQIIEKKSNIAESVEWSNFIFKTYFGSRRKR